MAVNTSVDVKIPKRSGFDKSYQNLFTTKVGTLTPILCDEVIPGSVVNLRAAVSASLPPLASDTFMRCDLKLEAFFVPYRILYGGFEDWYTSNKIWSEDDGDYIVPKLPYAQVRFGGANASAAQTNYSWYKPGSLLDYLNFKHPYVPGVGETGGVAEYSSGINIFPLLAYHKIYDDWYRNTQVQRPVFQKPLYAESPLLGHVPYWTTGSDLGYPISTALYNGAQLGSLHQRNFGLDYFTTASPSAQKGDESKITFDTSGASGNFTIAALRAANSLQQFAERNAIAGNRMQDYVRAHFGAKLSSGVAQRAIYLGSDDIVVYNKGVSANSDLSGASTNNPFTSVGSQYGRAFAAGNGTLIDHFEVDEPGCVMVLCSLVPKVTYASGIDRMWSRMNASNAVPAELADPLLENVGNQPIFQYELAGENYKTSLRGAVFGYTDRFADWKNKFDQCHGLLRDGQSLESFALQRTLAGNVQLTAATFLPIPINYLDQVSAVTGDISSYGIWIDSFLDYKVSMPLSQYAIPSLQDPAYEHGYDVKVDIRGSKL